MIISPFVFSRTLVVSSVSFIGLLKQGQGQSSICQYFVFSSQMFDHLNLQWNNNKGHHKKAKPRWIIWIVEKWTFGQGYCIIKIQKWELTRMVSLAIHLFLSPSIEIKVDCFFSLSLTKSPLHNQVIWMRNYCEENYNLLTCLAKAKFTTWKFTHNIHYLENLQTAFLEILSDLNTKQVTNSFHIVNSEQEFLVTWWSGHHLFSDETAECQTNDSPWVSGWRGCGPRARVWRGPAAAAAAARRYAPARCPRSRRPEQRENICDFYEK